MGKLLNRKSIRFDEISVAVQVSCDSQITFWYWVLCYLWPIPVTDLFKADMLRFFTPPSNT